MAWRTYFFVKARRVGKPHISVGNVQLREVSSEQVDQGGLFAQGQPRLDMRLVPMQQLQ
jgi:hypothetical protein